MCCVLEHGDLINISSDHRARVYAEKSNSHKCAHIWPTYGIIFEIAHFMCESRARRTLICCPRASAQMCDRITITHTHTHTLGTITYAEALTCSPFGRFSTAVLHSQFVHCARSVLRLPCESRYVNEGSDLLLLLLLQVTSATARTSDQMLNVSCRTTQVAFRSESHRGHSLCWFGSSVHNRPITHRAFTK